MNVLDRIVAGKREEVASLRAWSAALRREAEGAGAGRGLAGALRRPGEVALLAEVKRRSPSAGWILEGADAAGVARVYELSGAAAVSVLTDEEWFGGRLDDVRSVKAAVEIPVLRKDFIVDAVQVWQARAAGADGYLLIVRILDDALLADLVALGTSLGMDALVEVHGEGELERALAAGASVVGVNSRDLTTFETDLAVVETMAVRAGDDVVLVGESGIGGPEDVERLGVAGVDAVLVGEALMRAADMGEAVERLTGHARRPRSGGASS
ncbi:MAG: indole-3-glycerol phosphate synthase TrpC [Gemmatimonadota bacterium]